MTTPASAASSPTAAKSERRGPALEVLGELLADGHTDAVIALFAKLVARNGELERKLADVLSRGRKNEGVSSAQLLLLIEGLAGQRTPSPDVAEADAKLGEAAALDPKPDTNEVKPKRQPPLRKPLPAHLRRVENPIAVPEGERPCPRCGGLRTCIGHDVTEVLDLIPAEVVVRVDKQEKLACVDCEAEVVRAPPWDKIVPGGRVGTSLVAQLLVDKYRDGLPLHRHKERFARLGLPVAVSTLADQVAWAAEALHPVWQEARRQVLAAEVMNFDGTGIAVRDSSRPDGIRLGTFWGAVGDDEVALYLYASTGKQHGQREGEMGPAEFLARRVGRTVVDAAPLFDTSFKRAGLVECGCNTHSRRYFRKVLAAGDSRAALPLAAFKKLYDIEEEVRGREPEEIRLERQTRSTPLYDELESWCRVRQPHEPPSSALGKAIGYLLNNVVPLRRFLDDGVIPIDNGAVERLHVRTALTRKNFLFAGSDTGAKRAAVVYSVLGCCAFLDINPVEYLADVLPRLSRRLRLASRMCLSSIVRLCKRHGMPTSFRKLNDGWNAEPNAPAETVAVDGDMVHLEFNMNPFQFKSFAPENRGRLTFFGCSRYRLGSTNDEGWYRGQCRFSSLAPAWGEFYEVAGDLFDERVRGWTVLRSAPESQHDRRFLFYLRDNTFECDAQDWRFEALRGAAHG